MSRIILGSSSPRRKDLLSRVGLKFSIIKPETEEVRREGESAKDYVERNAQEKAQWVSSKVASEDIVISSDTVVVVGDRILEKPKSHSDATEMLTLLSDATHAVISGVCIRRGNKEVVFSCTTSVTLKKLSSGEIGKYIESGEPMDKAGSYAAQGIGSYMVKNISGSYANVVGLPIAEVVEILETEFQVSLWN